MAKPKTTAISRFWGRVLRGPGCWLWTGAKDECGYGVITEGGRRGRGFPGKAFKTHRLSWSFAYGEIPSGMSVLHKCDTPACVRPDHLFLGTQRENVADCVGKGRNRGATGTKNCKAKLREDEVQEIRFRVARGESIPACARAFGIDRGTAWRIVRYKMWAHIP